MTTVLERNPALHGVVFDLPRVAGGAQNMIRDRGLESRCEAVGGSFFESVPEGADGYMMKHIIHDWDDERAVAILRNIRRAMADDGRLLVIEMVIAPGNEPAFGKLLDLEMLAIAGGRERTGEEFRELFAAAGFAVTEVIPTQSTVSIIEGRPV